MNTLDMTKPPEKSSVQGTGPVVTRKPVYQNSLPPCNHTCPAGNDIQGALALAQEGRFEQAWRTFMNNNPLPATHGRICYHPCEDGCSRVQVDDGVSIHAIERFLGDMAIEQNWPMPTPKSETGKKVLVVGAGPSGLSAAYHLRLLGHTVEIREAAPIAGGMMQFGIPAYRLPRDVLAAEIARIESMGISITLNHRVEDLLAEKQEGEFDAVYLAIGAHIGKQVDIPARDAGKVLDAVSFLRETGVGEQPVLGRRVAVYGGGNTAMDAARTVKRMGVDEAMIIYRRDRDHMPAHRFEADEAEAEGVNIHWLRTIQNIEGSEFNVEIMEIGDDGRPHPTGRFETLAVDSLILALGQDVERDMLDRVPGLEFDRWGSLTVDDQMMTGCAGIFAGGDMVPSDRTATIAVGHGKKAARFMDSWLTGKKVDEITVKHLVDFDGLHLWYRTRADRQHEHALSVAQRNDFSEVVHGLSEAQVRFEASRCFSCGNCFECDGCFGACPEGAITKLGKGEGYQVNHELCTGCLACYRQCPCHAIEMQAVQQNVSLPVMAAQMEVR
ncbi:NAD(P)-binding protein [Endozoicomonas acroporae]|uniref:NAD(P)-binding protein n=1 Tax=Endozoicomonas acroporae TaxID=1701104 RepID=UPI000C77736B|nr:NAD(P)-binding protein [Endozoicomonas acroporae]